MTELRNPKAFFAYLRETLLGPTLSSDEVSGCASITDAVGAADWPLAHAAYALATAYHETAHSMQPIREFGGPAYFFRMYDIKGQRPALARANGNINPGDGVKFYGRGYVQLTWRGNYARAAQALGVPLVENPDLALNPDIAAKIMVQGMAKGWFTGKSCSSYLPDCGAARSLQYLDARRIINGTDKAQMIAGYAEQFQEALLKGEWA